MMKLKKLFLMILLFFFAGSAVSQIKQRSGSTNTYLGIGYKFVFLTDPLASDAYPFFQLSTGSFLQEVAGFGGVVFNDRYCVEFAPSYLFSNSTNSDGFYYPVNNVERYFLPVQTSLFATPLNLRFKYYPFAANYKSAFSKMYFGAGAGMMYVKEEITSQVYSDETLSNYLGARSGEFSFWTADYEVLVGIGSFSKIGFGFELSYRFVPLSGDHIQPVITSLVSNFNSVNISANILYGF